MARPYRRNRAYTHQDLTNQRFDRLIVISEAGRNAHRSVCWLCLCDCGNSKITTTSNLKKGNTKSCGCLQHEGRSKAAFRHGMSHTPEHMAWMSMMERCDNPTHPSYEHYGAKGVTVCDRWRNSFEAFFADMGSRPPDKSSIDRHPDRDGNYEPGNCRWANSTEQNRNRRTSRFITWHGETRSLAEWAEILGVSRCLISDRIERGWTIEEAMTIRILKKSERKPR